ncbi:MAG: hemerythrin domain-containing protein [Planctomycetota bacterium]|jgi:hypothetical protein
MSTLTKEFKREHAEIIAMLNEVKELGILSKEGHAKLMSIKEHLLAHLKKEEVMFYPVLYKEAECSERLKTTLDLFTMDMDKVSSIVQKFFDKYSEGAFDEEFPIELENLLAAFKARVKNEEDALYEEYDNIMKDYQARILNNVK